MQVLTERLRHRYLEWRRTADADIPQQLLDQLASEALAFVAERLPTRETWGRVLYHLDCPDGDPVECPHWESELYAEEREDFMRKADALLRDLRERLGVRT